MVHALLIADNFHASPDLVYVSNLYISAISLYPTQYGFKLYIYVADHAPIQHADI